MHDIPTNFGKIEREFWQKNTLFLCGLNNQQVRGDTQERH